jgi:hypothetical protein
MQPSNTLRRRPVMLLLLALAGVVALLAVGGWLWFGSSARDERQAEVAARGAEVMPFDLERTTHIFEPQTDGGLQQVVADDSGDAEQIALIRSHLQEEATKFQRGDFSDPAAIHGDAMPGLAELRRGHAQIDVAYSELPNGAQIRYTTDDPAVISALHAWFAAQLSDHGGHAMEHGAPSVPPRAP